MNTLSPIAQLAARAVLALISVVYLAAGAYCIIRPNAVSEGLGLTPLDGGARAELLAVYGGLELGLGLFFGLCAILSGWQICGLAAGVLTFGLLVAVRVVAAVWFRSLHGTTLALLILELVLGAAASAVLVWGAMMRGGPGGAA